MKPIICTVWSFRGVTDGSAARIRSPDRWLWIPGSRHLIAGLSEAPGHPRLRRRVGGGNARIGNSWCAMARPRRGL